MNKNMPNQRPKPGLLVPLLVRVKTAPSVQCQLELLCGAGEFRSINIYPITDQEKVATCERCGAVTTPWGRYGDLLELEFRIEGYRLTFTSRETWAGGRASLRELMKNGKSYQPNLHCQTERLRIKGLPRPIQTFFSKVAEKPQRTSTETTKFTNATDLVEPSAAVSWVPVSVSSFSFREQDRAPLGLNSAGTELNHRVEGLRQCAADLNVYPLGSILCIKVDGDEEFRIVTHSRPHLKGAHQLDLHFDSLTEMEANGTHTAELIIVRLGWNAS